MTVHEWFAEYAKSHQNPTNKAIHWVCVPTIMWTVLALFVAIPMPQAVVDLAAWQGPAQAVPYLNVGTLFALGALAWYLSLSVPLALGMVPVAGLMLVLAFVIQGAGLPLALVALVVFVLAWIGQFIGHKIEGKKPSFLRDLQFLLVGPLWLLGFVYKGMGLRY